MRPPRLQSGSRGWTFLGAIVEIAWRCAGRSGIPAPERRGLRPRNLDTISTESPSTVASLVGLADCAPPCPCRFQTCLPSMSAALTLPGARLRRLRWCWRRPVPGCLPARTRRRPYWRVPVPPRWCGSAAKARVTQAARGSGITGPDWPGRLGGGTPHRQSCHPAAPACLGCGTGCHPAGAAPARRRGHGAQAAGPLRRRPWHRAGASCRLLYPR